MESTPTLKLQTGPPMPAVGYGTWQSLGDELSQGVAHALECGYRHIDCAAAYENEHIIGSVLTQLMSSGKISREDLFITTKIPPVGNRPSGVQQFLESSLKKLSVDFVDMLLIHVPFAFKEGEDMHPFDESGNIVLDTTTDHVAIWKAMEEALESGRTKAIGLSNFNKKQIQKILDNCKIPPSNLQIELHAYCQQKELLEFCSKNNIVVTAYSPLGSRGSGKLFSSLGYTKGLPDLLNDPIVLASASELKVTPSQVLLKHLVDKGVSVIPKSTSKEHIQENFEILKIQISEDIKQKLDQLDKGEKGRILDFSIFRGVEKHPEYPF